jgi:hypothetical protein
MRRLPGGLADGLAARIVEQVRRAAAAGRWEQAVEELIAALHARGEAVTTKNARNCVPCSKL